MKRWQYKVFGSAVAVCCAVSAIFLYRTHQRELLISRGKEGAERIFVALESYRSEHGVYPNSLDELVPTYMKGLPKPFDSMHWEYWSHAKGFAFAFGGD